jgi:hypothetical protein
VINLGLIIVGGFTGQQPTSSWRRDLPWLALWVLSELVISLTVVAIGTSLQAGHFGHGRPQGRTHYRRRQYRRQ